MAGNAVGVLDDDPVGKLKVFVYEMPRKYNKMLLDKDSRCLHHMFAAEIFMHQFLLSSAVRTLDPEEADWLYTPVYRTCDLMTQPFRAPPSTSRPPCLWPPSPFSLGSLVGAKEPVVENCTARRKRIAQRTSIRATLVRVKLRASGDFFPKCLKIGMMDWGLLERGFFDMAKRQELGRQIGYSMRCP